MLKNLKDKLFGKNDASKELAASAELVEEEVPAEIERKEKPKSLLHNLGAIADTAKGFKTRFDEIYGNWIKPIYDNRAQIKRRLNLISTLISLIFFLIYIPLILFGKIYKELNFGWQVALYACIGVYLVMLIALLAVTLITTRNNTAAVAAKRRKRTSKIILLIVRIASVALSITAVVITSNASASPMHTLAMVVAIISIIFSVIPLMFGGFAGFCKWLISPAPTRVKRSFNAVANEWNEMLEEGGKTNKVIRKAHKKFGNKIDACLDRYLFPTLGQKNIKSISGDGILKALSSVPECDLNLTEWMLKEIFSYADKAGYIEDDPCAPLKLAGSLEQELRQR